MPSILWHHHDGENRRWCGEYWPDPDDDTGAPWGVCWVGVYPPLDGGTAEQAVLWFVLVDDRRRRQGVATALIASARSRWPGLWLTDGVTPAGEALHASVTATPDLT